MPNKATTPKPIRKWKPETLSRKGFLNWLESKPDFYHFHAGYTATDCPIAVYLTELDGEVHTVIGKYAYSPDANEHCLLANIDGRYTRPWVGEFIERIDGYDADEDGIPVTAVRKILEGVK